MKSTDTAPLCRNSGMGGRCNAMPPEQQKALIALLKEARSIIRASSSRQLAKDWDTRATQALKDAK